MVVVVSVLAGLAAVVVLAGLHWYLWRRLVRDSTRKGSRWRLIGAGVLGLGTVLTAGAFGTVLGGVSGDGLRWLAWSGFLWAAVFLYLLVGVLAGEIVRPLLLRGLIRRDAGTGAPNPAAPTADTPERTGAESDDAESGAPVTASATAAPAAPDHERQSRRLLLSRLAAGATVLAAGAVVGTGTYGVLNGPAVRRVTVPLAKLPVRAHGLRIALVSDLHLGPVLGRGFCETVVRTVNETRPDVIAVVGDLTDGSVAELRAQTEPLAALSAPLGTFFVPGNHEYYSDADAWLEQMNELGMRVVLNDRVALPDFDLAGVGDPTGREIGRGPDFAAALDGRDTERVCVMLAHQPVLVHDSVRYGVDLQLSGHTHGGQVWPGNLLARLANPTVAGMELYGGTALYVTRGAGAWGPPTRVAAPSDITVLELASPQEA